MNANDDEEMMRVVAWLTLLISTRGWYVNVVRAITPVECYHVQSLRNPGSRLHERSARLIVADTEDGTGTRIGRVYGAGAVASGIGSIVIPRGEAFTYEAVKPLID